MLLYRALLVEKLIVESHLDGLMRVDQEYAVITGSLRGRLFGALSISSNSIVGVGQLWTQSTSSRMFS